MIEEEYKMREREMGRGGEGAYERNRKNSSIHPSSISSYPVQVFSELSARGRKRGGDKVGGTLRGRHTHFRTHAHMSRV